MDEELIVVLSVWLVNSQTGRGMVGRGQEEHSEHVEVEGSTLLCLDHLVSWIQRPNQERV